MTSSASSDVYEVLVERRAERDMRRLPEDVASRVNTAIRKLAPTPRPVGCRKLVGSDSDWRLRVGDYRIVYQIDDEAKQVRVMFIRHRREAYR